MAVRAVTALTLVETTLFVATLLMLMKPNSLCLPGQPIYNDNGSLTHWEHNEQQPREIRMTCRQFTFAEYVCKPGDQSRRFNVGSHCLGLATPSRLARLLCIAVGICSINLLTMWRRTVGVAGIFAVHGAQTACAAIQLVMWSSFQASWRSNGTTAYGITSSMSIQPGDVAAPQFPAEWRLVHDLTWTSLLLMMLAQTWIIGPLPYQRIEWKTVIDKLRLPDAPSLLSILVNGRDQR